MTIPSPMNGPVCPDGALQEAVSVELQVRPGLYVALRIIAADKGTSVAAIVNEILYRALPWASLPIDQTRCH